MTWVDRTLRSLTLEEQIGQLFTVRAYGRFLNAQDPDYRRLLRLVEETGVGGVAFFQGTPESQVELTRTLQRHARVPLLLSQDMEWGAAMRVRNTTLLPRAMGLGATRDATLARAVGWVTGAEARALGVDQVYAPVLDVNVNPANPIINVRSFGERPELVGEMGSAFARGIAEAGVMPTAKHFPGHGDTNVDSHSGLPILPFRWPRLERVELSPFRALVGENIPAVMVGHLALPEVDRAGDPRPASLSPFLIEDLLRERLGFEGLVVTDALEMRSLTERHADGELAVRALEAGADILLISSDTELAHRSVLEAVRSGRLDSSRVAASVRRILTAKAQMYGRGGAPTMDTMEPTMKEARAVIGRPLHRAIARTAGRRALTLVRNQGDLLPVAPGEIDISVITLSSGRDAEVGKPFVDALRRNAPEARVTHMLIDRRSDRSDRQRAAARAERADLALLALHLPVSMSEDTDGLPYLFRDAIRRIGDGDVPLAAVSFGNPYLLDDFPGADAFLATFGEGALMEELSAEAIFGRTAVSGKLPISLSEAYPFGHGLAYEQRLPRRGLPETVGMRTSHLQRIDSLMRSAIGSRAFPGAAVAVGRAGTIVKLDGYGYHTYEGRRPVSATSTFDLASLTKVIATATAAMLLYERGQLDLDAPVARYLPAFAQRQKGEVTIRHLLGHTSGLAPFRPYYRSDPSITREELLEAVLGEALDFAPGSRVQYSDLGFITLMLVVEEITSQPFAQFVEREILQPLHMSSTGFRRTGHPDEAIVPTERDHHFRDRLIEGEVHDETAWMLGGVSGHAGLFSTATDLANYATMIVQGGRFDGRRFLEKETIDLFTTRVAGSRALGWDTRSVEGYSSAGSLFSEGSFGHTGFTGTSLWIDPERDLYAILLTNRVYPDRSNTKIREVRPAFADLAACAVDGPPRLLLPAVLRE